MITLRNVHKSFGRQTLFDGADLQINNGDRFVLVGPNGAGKSTLFKMLLGRESADSGEMSTRRGAVVGYLPQENPPISDATVLEESLKERLDPDGRTVAKAKAILMGLGFKVADFGKKMNALSGGWAMRAALAGLLAQEPDLLLLDEPTNHLDIDSLFWLQQYLRSYPGAVFLISHDRAFINAVCRAIVSVQDGKLKVYRGDYEFFLRERQAERERLEMAWRRQQEEIAKMQEFIDRNRARASTANRAQSMIKRLDKLERIVLPAEAKSVKIRFPQPARTGVRVLSLRDVYKSYGETKVYQGLDFELERGWKMAFVGHNGAGKSTLLKVLAGVIPFDSGERVVGNDVKVGYFSQHRQGQLDPEKTVLQEASSVGRLNPDLLTRTILGTFLFPGDSVHKKTEVLSGGEKSRLSLAKLLLDPPNVLLMDEPTTHLDMASVDALVEALRDFEGAICCISHDLYFLNALADHVVHIDQGRITVYPGNYEYFKRRQSQWREENPQAEPKEENAGNSESGRPGKSTEAAPSPEDRRRQEKRAAKIKAELEALHAALESLASRLADPELYADYEKVRSIGEEMESVQKQIQEKEARISQRA
ncbi:MAG TPA: ABC-F family ATP-binding cassette domain-containing protein [Elusimicrobiota bacterium]|nr:ABC-F family ATP-binding cassette domain-containing protein [Elusimicrobiota bacterium]